MSAVYTVDSLSALRYGVVQVQQSAPGATLPPPARIPEVAESKIPDRHKSRASAGGEYRIILRHESEPDPLPDAGIDWIQAGQMVSHIADNRDVWTPEEAI